MNCKICLESQPAFVGARFDDRYGFAGVFPLLRCSECEHLFLDCRMTQSELIGLYTNYYPRKTFDISQCEPHAEASGLSAWLGGANGSAFRWVPRDVRVLDIGCGFGQSLGYHARRGCEVYGVEADENIRRVADKFGYEVHVGLFDDGVYEPEFFDYVTLDQVIEHVADPLSTLRGVARVLKPGGTVVLSTPNASGLGSRIFGARWIHWHAPYHLQFFSRKSMRMAAEQAGFVVTDAKTITNSEWLYYQWLHLAAYPKQGHPSAFWSHGSEPMSSFRRRVFKIIRFVHRAKLNHLLTRILDWAGVGDNFIFVLKKQ